ncbi:hypothetical protein F5B20DRAFT_584656 [Whalleya microplaca]|nr:hypothetical protein F5B20DRAFT_584656 [Whalleya microplaca]
MVGYLPAFPNAHRNFSSGAVEELDVVMLYRSRQPKYDENAILTPPLEAGTAIELEGGVRMPASHIIGRQLGDYIKTDDGKTYIIQRPTLASYLMKTPRTKWKSASYAIKCYPFGSDEIAPMIPNDARSMVSLLDLHLEHALDITSNRPSGETIEILGTELGHGSLLLHLLQAIHLANPPNGRPLTEAIFRFSPEFLSHENGPMLAELASHDKDVARKYYAYLRSRYVVVNFVHSHLSCLRTALRNVHHFERARYLLDVDFYHMSMSMYLKDRLNKSGGKSFLHYALIDHSRADSFSSELEQAMHPGGLVVLYTTSPEEISRFDRKKLHQSSRLFRETTIQTPFVNVPGGGNILTTNPVLEWDLEFKSRMSTGLPTYGGNFITLFRKDSQAHNYNLDNEYRGPKPYRVATWPRQEVIITDDEASESESGSMGDTEPLASARNSVKEPHIAEEASDERIEQQISSAIFSVAAEIKKVIQDLQHTSPVVNPEAPSSTKHRPNKSSGLSKLLNDLQRDSTGGSEAPSSTKHRPDKSSRLSKPQKVPQRDSTGGPKAPSSTDHRPNKTSGLSKPRNVPQGDSTDGLSEAAELFAEGITIQDKDNDRRPETADPVNDDTTSQDKDNERQSQATDKTSTSKQSPTDIKSADRPDGEWGTWWRKNQR